MDNHKPYRSLLFTLTVFIILALLTGLFGGREYSFVTGRLYLPEPGHILEQQLPFLSEQTSKPTPTPETADSIGNDNSNDSRISSDSDSSAQSRATRSAYPEGIFPIVFSDSSRSDLLVFFESLRKGEVNSRMVHILHYGDSQIEGDRFSEKIRSELQKRFGGSGLGVIPAVPPSYLPSGVEQQTSGEWAYTSFVNGSSETQRISLLGGISSIDSAVTDVNIRIKRRYRKVRNSRFSRIRLLYGYCSDSIRLSVLDSDTSRNYSLSPYWGVEQLPIPVSLQAKTITLNFKGGGIKILGLSLESKHGVFVDNIALRGSSGLFFNNFDKLIAKKLFTWLNVRLVILQFGVNIVPANLNSYRYYEEMFYRQIRSIKQMKPRASVIVIGVSDMSYRKEGEFVSLPAVKKVRNAQRSAAKRAGAAFWDCLEAMGGLNSMPQWVYASPPLATKDFTHFTPKGARKLAEMFTRSLLFEYDQYLKQHNLSAREDHKEPTRSSQHVMQPNESQ